MVDTFTYDDSIPLYENVNAILSDLHGFITKINRPKLLDKKWTEKIKSELKIISEDLCEVHQGYEEKKKSLGESFFTSVTRIQKSMREYAHELSERPNGRRIETLYESMSRDYEELISNIKTRKIAQIKAVHLKPSNYARNIFHVSCGISCFILYQFLLTREIALMVMGCFIAVFGTLEITRRMSKRWNVFLVEHVFGIIARPHEMHKTNGATYFLLAMFVIAILFQKPVALIGVLILTFADPAASILGKLWGRRKLFKEKSFVGTFAFLIVAFTASFSYLFFAVSSFSVAYMLLTAAVVSIFATVIELFSISLDDNFTIPVGSALVASLFF